MSAKVFFITGCSTGFGAELVKVCLKQGATVVATARDPSKLEFEGTSTSNYLALPLDVTDKESIDNAFEKALSQFKRIDVLVNNAGYGLSGEFEALEEKQIRQQMEVNFFGLLDCTRKGLEVMRDRNSPQGGLIMQVTSIGGQRGVPTFSIYCASKWAVEGFTEALSQEVKPDWGIKFCNIEPGGFRTDWAGRSMTFADRHPAYDHINAKETMNKRHGTQVGDPPKAAQAMYDIATMSPEEVPLRVVLGSDAYKAINEKLDKYRDNYKKFEKISNSTDVDDK